MGKIFISYRRIDSIAITGRIHDRLVAEFGDENVFKDMDDIPPGADFRKIIREAILQCDVLLVIIGNEWLKIADERGRRLENEDDFVRIEVEAGLNESYMLVVPTLVDNAKIPKEKDLPETLRDLAFRNAVDVRHDPDFNRDMDRLIKHLRKYFEAMNKVGGYIEQIMESEKDAPWIKVADLFREAKVACGNFDNLVAVLEAEKQYYQSRRLALIDQLQWQVSYYEQLEPPDISKAMDLRDRAIILSIDAIPSEIESAQRGISQRQEDKRRREKTISLIDQIKKSQRQASWGELEKLIEQARGLSKTFPDLQEKLRLDVQSIQKERQDIVDRLLREANDLSKKGSIDEAKIRKIIEEVERITPNKEVIKDRLLKIERRVRHKRLPPIKQTPAIPQNPTPVTKLPIYSKREIDTRRKSVEALLNQLENMGKRGSWQHIGNLVKKAQEQAQGIPDLQEKIKLSIQRIDIQRQNQCKNLLNEAEYLSKRKPIDERRIRELLREAENLTRYNNDVQKVRSRVKRRITLAKVETRLASMPDIEAVLAVLFLFIYILCININLLTLLLSKGNSEKFSDEYPSLICLLWIGAAFISFRIIDKFYSSKTRIIFGLILLFVLPTICCGTFGLVE